MMRETCFLLDGHASSYKPGVATKLQNHHARDDGDDVSPCFFRGRTHQVQRPPYAPFLPQHTSSSFRSFQEEIMMSSADGLGMNLNEHQDIRSAPHFRSLEGRGPGIVYASPSFRSSSLSVLAEVASKNLLLVKQEERLASSSSSTGSSNCRISTPSEHLGVDETSFVTRPRDHPRRVSVEESEFLDRTTSPTTTTEWSYETPLPTPDYNCRIITPPSSYESTIPENIQVISLAPSLAAYKEMMNGPGKRISSHPGKQQLGRRPALNRDLPDQDQDKGCLKKFNNDGCNDLDDLEPTKQRRMTIIPGSTCSKKHQQQHRASPQATDRVHYINDSTMNHDDHDDDSSSGDLLLKQRNLKSPSQSKTILSGVSASNGKAGTKNKKRKKDTLLQKKTKQKKQKHDTSSGSATLQLQSRKLSISSTTTLFSSADDVDDDNTQICASLESHPDVLLLNNPKRRGGPVVQVSCPHPGCSDPTCYNIPLDIYKLLPQLRSSPPTQSKKKISSGKKGTTTTATAASSATMLMPLDWTGCTGTKSKPVHPWGALIPAGMMKGHFGKNVIGKLRRHVAEQHGLETYPVLQTLRQRRNNKQIAEGQHDHQDSSDEEEHQEYENEDEDYYCSTTTAKSSHKRKHSAREDLTWKNHRQEAEESTRSSSYYTTKQQPSKRKRRRSRF